MNHNDLPSETIEFWLSSLFLKITEARRAVEKEHLYFEDYMTLILDDVIFVVQTTVVSWTGLFGSGSGLRLTKCRA